MATYGEHPYICSLQRRSGFQYHHICGCVIYNQNTVITAAHCLDGSLPSSLRIQAGTHDMSEVDDYQVTRSITQFTMHPQYSGNAAGFPNDIAVMQLSSPLSFNSYISAANISSSSSQVNQDCILSGWGRTSGGGSAATILKKVTMTTISNSECLQRWSAISGASINSGHICFFDPPRSACSGDSGGPVRCNGEIACVTSWGISSCNGNYPSVYTRLSYFADWMRNNAY